MRQQDAGAFWQWQTNSEPESDLTRDPDAQLQLGRALDRCILPRTLHFHPLVEVPLGERQRPELCGDRVGSHYRQPPARDRCRDKADTRKHRGGNVGNQPLTIGTRQQLQPIDGMEEARGQIEHEGSGLRGLIHYREGQPV